VREQGGEPGKEQEEGPGSGEQRWEPGEEQKEGSRTTLQDVSRTTVQPN